MEYSNNLRLGSYQAQAKHTDVELSRVMIVSRYEVNDKLKVQGMIFKSTICRSAIIQNAEHVWDHLP